MPPMVAPIRIALRLAYLGADFCGWQRQQNARTVQGELERALANLYAQPVRAFGAGRTDTGVHATGQVAHFDAPFQIPMSGLVKALNSALAADLRVLGARMVPPSFHARSSAVAKCYRYRLAWGPPLDPWESLRRVELPCRPDLAAMLAGLAIFEGTHDFRAFARSGHSGHGARGTWRTVHAARLHVRGARADFVVEGDGFLRGMVRRLTGALIEVGRGAQSLAWLGDLVAGHAASPAAPTAPARGLTLERVFYRPPARVRATEELGPRAP